MFHLILHPLFALFGSSATLGAGALQEAQAEERRQSQVNQRKVKERKGKRKTSIVSITFLPSPKKDYVVASVVTSSPLSPRHEILFYSRRDTVRRGVAWQTGASRKSAGRTWSDVSDPFIYG